MKTFAIYTPQPQSELVDDVILALMELNLSTRATVFAQGNSTTGVTEYQHELGKTSAFLFKADDSLFIAEYPEEGYQRVMIKGITSTQAKAVCDILGEPFILTMIDGNDERTAIKVDLTEPMVNF